MDVQIISTKKKWILFFFRENDFQHFFSKPNLQPQQYESAVC